MTKDEQMMVANKLPKSYAELVALHVPRPIRDPIAYKNTVQMVDALAGYTLNRDQQDYLEILSQQIEAYEADTLKPVARVGGIALLRALLGENDLSGDDLAGILQVDRSVAYKILKGTRKLTAAHVRKLSDHFAVSADAFLAG